LSGIEFAPVTVVATAFAASDLDGPLDGFGFLVPRAEQRPILGTLWDSSVFEDRAPGDSVLLRTMVGGARDPETAGLPEHDVLALVLEQLRELMGIRASPVMTRVYRWKRGIPQYNVGHRDILAAVDAGTAGLDGLFLCHNSYRGVSLNDCAREAEITAAALLDRLFPRAGDAEEDT